MSEIMDVNEALCRAHTYVRNGKHNRAIDLLRDAVSRVPNAFEVKIQLARYIFIYLKNDYEAEREALCYLYSVIDSSKSNDYLKNKATLELGSHLRYKGYLYDAYEVLYPLLSVKEFKDGALFELGLIESFLGNSEEAEKYLTEYKGKHDEPAMLELTKIFISRGEEDTVKNNLKLLSQTMQKDKALAEEMFYEIKNRNYDRAYELYKKARLSRTDIKPENLDNIKLYLEFMTGKRQITKNKKNYFEFQLCGYSRGRAISYIGYADRNTRSFYHYINLEALFDYAHKMIMNKNPYRYEMIEYYLVDCKEEGCNTDVANVHGVGTHYLKVGVLPHTKNIISIRPVECLDGIKKKLKNNGHQRTR